MSPARRSPLASPPGFGSVHLWSKSGRFPAALVELIDQRIRIVTHQDKLGDPDKIADYLVSSASLTATFEREAARESATPVVLPQGGDWLRTQIARKLATATDVHVRVFTQER